MVPPTSKSLKPAKTTERELVRSESARAEKARQDFDLVAGMVAAHRPFDPRTEQVGDLEMLEAATALTTKK
ncbi:hypothetical protein [Methylobacterium oryzisoli]|uniref:hypothetical protein n=1 Tax=Methylobacterium oryzisoli TaxID=3385502 RepID=UPI003891A38D